MVENTIIDYTKGEEYYRLSLEWKGVNNTNYYIYLIAAQECGVEDVIKITFSPVDTNYKLFNTFLENNKDNEKRGYVSTAIGFMYVKTISF